MTSVTLAGMDNVATEYKVYPQFLLFGDSITQGSHRTLIPNLSEWYQRRLDVVNRGFSGYNAPLGLEVLSQFFPATSPSSSVPRVRLMTVFFGTNDACIPGSPQHVPLEEYADTLRQIANYDGLRLHGTQVIFIVPGPIDEYQITDGQRTASRAAMYAAACRETASDLNIPALDLWTTFMLKAGWKPGDPSEQLIGSLNAPKSRVLAELLVDGLHFSGKAYDILYDELKALTHRRLPDHMPEKVPVLFPDWKNILA